MHPSPSGDASIVTEEQRIFGTPQSHVRVDCLDVSMDIHSGESYNLRESQLSMDSADAHSHKVFLSSLQALLG